MDDSIISVNIMATKPRAGDIVALSGRDDLMFITEIGDEKEFMGQLKLLDLTGKAATADAASVDGILRYAGEVTITVNLAVLKAFVEIWPVNFLVPLKKSDDGLCLEVDHAHWSWNRQDMSLELEVSDAVEAKIRSVTTKPQTKSGG